MKATLQARADACAGSDGDELIKEYEKKKEEVEALREKVFGFERDLASLRADMEKIKVLYLIY